MFQHLTDNLARDPDYLDRMIDEKEAAGFMGYSVRALQGWRVKGGGPEFIKVSLSTRSDESVGTSMPVALRTRSGWAVRTSRSSALFFFSG